MDKIGEDGQDGGGRDSSGCREEEQRGDGIDKRRIRRIAG